MKAFTMRAFRLADWHVSSEDGSLTRAGVSKRLEPQIMTLLLYMSQRAGEVVSKLDILDNVWQTRYISDETLKSAFHALRRALDDDPRAPKYIETLPKRGYRLLIEPEGLDRDALQRGHAIADDATRESLNQARLYFERVLKNDPDSAVANAGLAQALATLALLGEDANDALNRATSAVERALKVEPNNALANAVAATIAFVRDRDVPRAQALFRNALKTAPKNGDVLRAYARFLTAIGRGVEAVECAMEAFRGNETSVAAERDLIGALFSARRFDEALAQAQHLLERYPDAADIRLGITFIYYLKRDVVQAYTAFLSALQHLRVQPIVLDRVREAYGTGGMPAVFSRWLDVLEREAMLGRRVSRDVITLHALLGHSDTAIEMLEQAREQREPYVLWLAVSPLLDGLRSDPRFSQLFSNR